MRNPMRNPTRAVIRWFLAAHSAFGAALIPALFLLGTLNTPTGITLAAIHAVSALCLAVDILVSRYYFRKIEMAVGPRSFFLFFAIEGSTWKILRAGAAEAEFRVGKVRVRAIPFPELDIERVIQTEGAERALKVIERAEHKAQSDAQEAKDRERREAKRKREAEVLLQSGTALGISEEDMRSFLAEGPGRARVAIARKEHELRLLKRADDLRCGHLLRPLLRLPGLEAAELLLVTVATLIERACKVGVEEGVRFFIKEDDLPLAEKLVSEKEVERAYQDLRGGLAGRIMKLPQPSRPDAQRLLEELDGQRPGTRDFGMVLHALNRKLG